MMWYLLWKTNLWWTNLQRKATPKGNIHSAAKQLTPVASTQPQLCAGAHTTTEFECMDSVLKVIQKDFRSMSAFLQTFFYIHSHGLQDIHTPNPQKPSHITSVLCTLIYTYTWKRLGQISNSNLETIWMQWIWVQIGQFWRGFSQIRSIGKMQKLN